MSLISTFVTTLQTYHCSPTDGQLMCVYVRCDKPTIYLSVAIVCQGNQIQ